jgi:hypothetical protein
MSLMAESGCLEQVDRGADNPTSYYKTITKPVKGGQGPVWVVAPLIIIIIILDIVHFLQVTGCHADRLFEKPF